MLKSPDIELEVLIFDRDGELMGSGSRTVCAPTHARAPRAPEAALVVGVVERAFAEILGAKRRGRRR